MFEIIKAYKLLRKAEKSLEGIRLIGVYTHDDVLLEGVRIVQKKHETLRKRMWRDRKLATRYIQNGKIFGFHNT